MHRNVTAITIIISCLIIFSFLIAGCSTREIPASEVVGKYKVTYGPYSGVILGTETLDVKADGTFDQVFTSAHGKVWKTSGTWHTEKDSAYDTTFVFENWLNASVMLGNTGATHPERTGFFTSVERKGSSMIIMINDDEDYYYRKLN